MTRPPSCGFSVPVAAAVADGAPLAAGPPDVHAVATRIDAAKTAMSTFPVRCFAVMCTPLAPFALPHVIGGRVYPAAHFAAPRRLYGRLASAVHFDPAPRRRRRRQPGGEPRSGSGAILSQACALKLY